MIEFDDSISYKILFVEDVNDDVKLAERFLKTEGIKFLSKTVDCENDLLSALSNFNPDIIISDYSLPGYDGISVINTVKKISPSTPIIVFTGSINEETAVECMKAGAVDYVLKEKLLKLPFSVKEALKTKEHKVKLYNTESLLAKSEEQFQKIIDEAPVATFILQDHNYIFANPVGLKIIGVNSLDELKKLDVFDTIAPEYHPLIKQRIKNIENNIKNELTEIELRRIDGTYIPCGTISTPITYNGKTAALIMALDLSEKKQTDLLVKSLAKELEIQNKLNQFFLLSKEDDLYYDIINLICNEINCTAGIIGYLNNNQELVICGNIHNNSKIINHCKEVIDKNRWTGILAETLINKRNVYTNIPTNILDFHLSLQNAVSVPILFQDKLLGIILLGNKKNDFNDKDLEKLNKISSYISPILSAKLEKQNSIESNKLTEEILNLTEERLRFALEASSDGIWDIDYKNNTMYWAPNTYKMLGYQVNEFTVDINKYVELIHPNERDSVWQSVLNQINTGDRSFTVEFRMRKKDGNYKCIFSRGKVVKFTPEGDILRIVGTHIDLTEIKDNQRLIKFQTEILDQITDLVVVTDLKGKIKYINKAEINVLGFSEAKFKNSDINLFGEDSSIGATQEEILNSTIKNGSWNGIVANITKDGKKIILNCRTWLLKNDFNEPYGIVGISTDITEQQAIYKKIIQSEEKFYKAFHGNSVGMIICNYEGVLLEINDAFCNLTEYSKDELLNKNIKLLNIFNYNDIAFIFTSDIDKNRKNDVELNIKNKQGILKVVNFSYDTILINNKNNFIFVLRDITRRKDAETILVKNEKLFRSIWENSKDGMRLTDKNGIMIKVNNAFCFMVGKAKSELEGFSISVIYSTEQTERVLNSYKHNFEKRKIHQYFENCYKLWNGKEIWFAVSNAFIVLDSNETLVLSIFRDISDKKIKEQELTESKNLALKSNQLKDAFIANISHEIRTPLNGILGMTKLLRESIDKGISDEQIVYFDNIYRNSNRIVRTIDMIVNFSRLAVDDFPLNPKEIDLNLLCRKIIKDLKPEADNKGLPIIFESFIEEAIIKVDEYCVTNGIIYILDNAIKFTEKGYIKISILDDANNSILLIIEDTGIGISEIYQDHLFEPYSQEEMGYRRTYEGIGLGLSLTKKFFALNNAKIEINSSKGEGTTVITQFFRQ